MNEEAIARVGPQRHRKKNGVRYVLHLPDCPTVQPGLKLKEIQDVNELIVLGFDIKLLE